MPKSGKPKPDKPKPEKRPSPIARVVAANVRALLAYAKRHPEDMAERATPVRLEAYIKAQGWGDSVGKSQLYRIRKADGGVGADVLELVARAFELQAWHMLVPELDPGNPPVLVVDESERALYRSIQQGAKRIREAAASHEQEDHAGSAGDHRDSASAAHVHGSTPPSKTKAGARPRARAKAKAP